MAQDDFEEFAKRVKQAESGGRRYDSKGNLLTSPKGAQGEMQVMPGTQKSPGFGVEPARAKTGEEIARVGKDYLRAMEQRYGNKEYAAVAYNWGPGNADKWIAQGADFSKLPKETQDYVKKVAPSATQAEQKPAAPPTEVPDYKALGRGPMTADLGSGYKAALALAFLGDEEDSDEKKLDEEEKTAAKELADYKSFNALSGLEFEPTKVPQLTAQAQPQVPVQRLADGGEVQGMTSNSPLTPEQLAPGGAIMLAEGGEVEEPCLPRVSSYSQMTATDMYPGQQGQFDQQDAARHMLAAGTLARKYGPGVAEMLGQAHEITTSPLKWIGSKLGISQMPIDYEQDLHNNRVGIDLATRSKSQKELEDLVQLEAERARKEKMPGAAWIGKPVRRAGGGDAEPTPEELEAASRPATVNPNIARQGAAARQLAAMRDVNTLPDPRTYAAVSGFLGTPPDQQGFSVLHPDLEGIKKAGDVGFAAGTAAQIAPAVGAVRNLVGKGTTEAARALDGLKNIPIGASTKGVEPIFQHLPSAEAPFVGRLDEFVAGLPNSVQKDQFLGMLKGKFRDYDIARAQETLADLPGNAKLAPVDLLNRIKAQYDPSQFKTTVIPPGKPGEFYQSMDNIYFNKDTGEGGPLGVIHLSQNLPPEVLQKQMAVKDAGLAISRIATQGTWSSFSPEVADRLVDIVKNPVVPLSEGTASKILSVARDYRQLAQADEGWEAAKSKMLYPILDRQYGPMREQILKDLTEANPGTAYYNHFNAADQMAVKRIVDEGNQWLVSRGYRPVELPDFSTMDSPSLYAATNSDMMAAITSAFDKARTSTLEGLKLVKERASEARQAFGDEMRSVSPYMGQHTSLNNPPSPIAFSRFSEQTAEVPGLGKLEGIYVNELQSDLLDDLRKFGPKGGTADKDTKLASQLWLERKNLEQKMYAAMEEGRLDEAKKLEEQAKIYVKKAEALMKRTGKAMRGEEGMYELPEAFAGMETSPQAVQQLMAKNAIMGAIQQGKSFVAFPGIESAQAQLYEKLPRNLKDVVKDLGPGFELRDITLTDANGRRVRHHSVIWGPEAAARIQKKGVPFKDGGLVERRTDDSRKYL